MVEDRIAALEEHAVALEARVRTLEGAAVEARPWAPDVHLHPERPVYAPAERPVSRPGAGARRRAYGSVPPPRVPEGPAARPRRLPRRQRAGVARRLRRARRARVPADHRGLARLDRRGRADGARRRCSRSACSAPACGCASGAVSTEAALAAAAVGIAGTFGTLVVAGPVYELVPRPLALLGAFAIGAAATALAMRWRAQVMGWLGLLGALWAPAALGAFDGGGIVFLAIAYAATVAVLVWQRWSLLAVFAAFDRDRAVGRAGCSSTRAATAPPRSRSSSSARSPPRWRSASRRTAAALHPVEIGPEARPRIAPGRGRAARARRRDPRGRRLDACSTASRGSSRSRSPTSRSASPPPASPASRASSR